MSLVKIQGNASGTGEFTIAAPNSNTNRTLTLPDATGTIITTAGGAAISGTTGAFTTTVGVGGATPSTSGSGISFPATASASSDANTLDDYEEGTWTGTLKGGTTDPTTPVTSTGRYTKIGRLVEFQISFENVNTTGASGQIRITNLPFTPSSGERVICPVAFFNMATFTGSTLAMVDNNLTTIYCYSNVSNAAWSDVTHNAGTSRYLSVSGTYTV